MKKEFPLSRQRRGLCRAKTGHKGEATKLKRSDAPAPLLIKNADLYDPAPQGITSLLILGGRIAQICPDLDERSIRSVLPDLVVMDVSGARTLPGLIDGHNHFAGAGGEGGFQFRTPPAQLTDFTRSGITTAVGLLGTDGYNRSLEDLLAKSRALDAEGLSTWIFTGSYQLPGPNLCGSTARDICLIDKVIGCKIALSDHRSSHPSAEALRSLVSSVRVSAMLAGKRGVVCVHMGSEETGLEPLREALRGTDVPKTQFLPTHVGRCEDLTRDAVRWVREGGAADITASDEAASRFGQFVVAGADVSRVTLTSDGNGSMPVFNEEKELVGMGVGSPSSILKTIGDIVTGGVADLTTAVSLATKNPAALLGLPGKGSLKPGFDADCLVLNDDWTVRSVVARGVPAVWDGKILVRGTYER